MNRPLIQRNGLNELKERQPMRDGALTRREVLAPLLLGLTGGPRKAGAPAYQLAPFSTEVTPPLGHPLMGGGIAPAQRVDDPLFASGFVLLGSEKPIVLAAVDWCEIRNDAYERWRTELARAAGTDAERVLVTSVHQHDAPIADLEAQRLLDAHKAAGRICDLEFHERTVQRVARDVREASRKARPLTHIGVGQAKVQNVASNRRYVGAEGKPAFDRTSATRDANVRDQPEGAVDPWLKTLSFWSGDRLGEGLGDGPVLALSCYATHPMSYYGKGGVSSDFVGLARRKRQAEEPNTVQVYASGCSGNVTAGKYNDGSPDNRAVLADRIAQAMALAWKETKRRPLGQVAFRTTPIALPPRNDAGFTPDDLQQRLRTDRRPFGQCLAALGLSWRKRRDAGRFIDLPVVDFGVAQLLLLPGESYVEYQLYAQSIAAKLRPDSLLMTMGYGECAPGYIPIEQAWQENDSNLRDWCWVAPGAERVMKGAIEHALLWPK